MIWRMFGEEVAGVFFLKMHVMYACIVCVYVCVCVCVLYVCYMSVCCMSVM